MEVPDGVARRSVNRKNALITVPKNEGDAFYVPSVLEGW